MKIVQQTRQRKNALVWMYPSITCGLYCVRFLGFHLSLSTHIITCYSYSFCVWVVANSRLEGSEKELNYRCLSEIKWLVQILASPLTISSCFFLEWALCDSLHYFWLILAFRCWECWSRTASVADVRKGNVVNVAVMGRCLDWTENINVLHVIRCFLRLHSFFYDFAFWLANDFLIKFFFFSCFKAHVSSWAVFCSSLSRPVLLSTTMFVLLCFEEQIEVEMDWQPQGEYYWLHRMWYLLSFFPSLPIALHLCGFDTVYWSVWVY